ncbi:MAG: branched-chain amino acid ABC transporter substrate-binding protein [Alphaproteobacteria bacterium]|nr:branched-chain amino acid ABC transporter substrate-binding protein [Alphaproteobacteria bacterium]
MSVTTFKGEVELKSKTKSRGVTGVVLGLALAAGLSAANAQQTLTIPFSGPLTGPIATYGLEPLHGAMLAAEDINKAGGLKAGPWKGFQIKLEQFDDRGDPQESANIAQKLVLNRDTVAVIGHIFSGNCLAALPIYEQNGLSNATPICSNPKITESGYKTIMRVVQDDVANGRAQAELAVKTLGGKKIGVLWANQDFGKGMFEQSTARLKELNVQFVAEPYNEKETDFNAIISRFKAAGVDQIMHLGFYTEAALQARQAKAQGLNVPFFAGPGVVSSEFIKLGGKDVEGVIVMDFMKEELVTPKLKELSERTKAAFKEGFNLYHRNGYDIMNFVAAGIEAAKEKSREAVRVALRGTTLKGLTYEIKLTDKGNLIVPADKLLDYYALKVVKDGKFNDRK